MSDYAVCVTIEVAPEATERFRRLLIAQAKASLIEPGCRVFDCWSDPERPGQVFLYEVYASRAAFEEHLATPHFLNFDTEAYGMVVEKRVMTWSVVAGASGKEALQ